MKRTPTPADIHAAELKLSMSLRHTREAFKDLHAASRSVIRRTRGIVWAGIAVATFYLFLVRRRQLVLAHEGARTVTTTSAVGVILALALHYGRQVIPFILRNAGSGQTHPSSPLLKP